MKVINLKIIQCCLVNDFVHKYNLEDFIVVADFGVVNNANIDEQEAQGSV